MSTKIHATALVEDGVTIGGGTSVWDNVHVREGAVIGSNCIVGEKTYIAGSARIGNLCKLNANVYVCAEVTIEDGVMVAAHTVFTNDLLPRATDPDITALRSSDVDESTLQTVVRRGATIGANCTIGPGIELGAFCMIGMGSVVTRNVPAYALMVGNPARLAGVVGPCGTVVAKATDGKVADGDYTCPDGRVITFANG